MKLTPAERWMLVNQCRILGALYPEDARRYADQRAALESGIELHYGEWAEIEQDEIMSEQDCLEALDILAMHRALLRGVEQAADVAGLDREAVRFRGFDAYRELKWVRFCRYYFAIEDRANYTELHQRTLTTHEPMLPRYRAMLAEWKRSANQASLTGADIHRIVNAHRIARGTPSPSTHH